MITGVWAGGPGRAPLARRGRGPGRRVVGAAGLLVAVVAGAPSGHATFRHRRARPRSTVLASEISTSNYEMAGYVRTHYAISYTSFRAPSLFPSIVLERDGALNDVRLIA